MSCDASTRGKGEWKVKDSVELQAILERDFNLICDCWKQIGINVKKTKVMLAGSMKKDHVCASFDDVYLQMNGTQVELVQ